MAKQNISIKQGDSLTIEETITGVASLEGYSAKLYIKTVSGQEVDVITGAIAALVITYDLLNEATKAYATGTHKYETKVYDAEDHVFTPSEGAFIVEAALVNDPS
jgi:hypothetical protein